MVESKVCSRCRVEKAVSEFKKDARYSGGVRGICKACIREYDRERYRRPEVEAERKRRISSPKVKAQRDEALRRWAERNPEKVRAKARKLQLKKKYGLSLEDYRRMVAARGGLCDCCGKEPRGKRGLFVDHDHVTEKVRGLLCYHCNSGIGRLGDDLGGVRLAEAYLRRAGGGDFEPFTFIA